jgi:hypothetical protein
MSRTLRVGLVFIGGLVLILITGLVVLYRAAKHVPQFYREALEADPEGQQKASKQMIQDTSDLAANLKKDGQWQARFTAEEVNGWLAVDLPKNYPDALGREFQEPRVAIAEDGVTLGCRVDQPGFRGVAWLAVDVYLQKRDPQKPNEIAVRIRKARLGAVPFPINKITEGISRGAGQAGVQVHWAQADGDPVALITLSDLRDNRGRLVEIDALQLKKGEIVVSGTTRKR